MSFSDHIKPVGHCTICFAPVYLIKNQIRRVCPCGTANVGNVTYTITALLQPSVLTDLTFPKIATGCDSGPSLLESPIDMDGPEESYSHASQRETDGIEEDNITADIANRMYGHAMRKSLDHLKTCTSCKFLAKQDEVCSIMCRLRKHRDRWLILKVTEA